MMLRILPLSFTDPSRYEAQGLLSSFNKAFKIAQPLKGALRILFTQNCFQWLQNMGKKSAKMSILIPILSPHWCYH